MSCKWSTCELFAEHKELQATSFCVSSTGVCALASRRAICLISSDAPSVIVQRIARNSKRDSCASQWNPITSTLLAITCAQSVQIYSCESVECSQPLVGTLGGHTRTITDLSWSHFDLNAIATASYDNNMHIWDIRDCRKAHVSMSSVAGASQVKWCPSNEHILATSHEGDVRIWDKRKSNAPVNYITAHLSKINGLEFNVTHSLSQFATCSQDASVRFWDLNSLKGKADTVLTTGLPVWRARYTPYGNGLLTALVPQLRRSGENNSLWLWSLQCLEQPIHSFVGHCDVVLDFGWHNKGNNDYQLITWSKDNTLRIWNLDPHLLMLPDSFDYSIDDMIDAQLIGNSSGTDDATDSSVPLRPSSLQLNEVLSPDDPSESKQLKSPETPVNSIVPPSLHQEFSLINVNIPNVKIEEMNANKRLCVITATTSVSCRLRMTFPPGYPNHVAPQFHFLNGPNAPSEAIKTELLKVLQTTAYFQVKRNRTCLEPCLRQFVATLERMSGSNTTVTTSPPSLIDLIPSHHYGSYLDASVPFPRTSGARFCASDILVCFGRPPHLEQMNAPTEFTPRSLSALSAYLSTHYRTSPTSEPNNMLSISSFYFNAKRKHKHKSRRSVEKTNSPPKHSSPNCGPVFVFTVSGLLPISKTLAENYVLSTNGDVVAMCEMNAKVAAKNGRRDLFQTWNLVKLSAQIFKKSLTDNCNMMEPPWPVHPFGKKLIQSLIDHAVLKCNDIQTAAMLACAFYTPDVKCRVLTKPIHCNSGTNSLYMALRLLKPGNSPYHTVGPAATAAPLIDNTWGEWNLISAVESLKRTRSNSWSDFAENEITAITARNESFSERDQIELETHENNLKMLDPHLQHQYDWYKQIYADMLFRWKLMEKRALILKCVSSANANQSLLFHVGIDFVTECSNNNCEKKNMSCRSGHCFKCHKPTLLCAICRLPVRGATNHCVICGHGGHALHMYQWFSQSDVCPEGCGCQCLKHEQPFA